MRTIQTIVKDITVTLTYKGLKGSSWGASSNQHHTITLKRDGKRASFDFWMSKAQPNIENENDAIGALSCVLSDAHAAFDTLENFIDAMGYEWNEGRKIYNACAKTLEKLERLGMDEEYICNVLNNELENI